VRLPALLLGPALLLTACTSGGTEPLSDSGDDPSAGSTARVAVLRAPEQPASVLSGSSPAELATATSTALYESAPLVLVADESDTAGQEQAAAVAASAGAPLLLTPTSGGTGPVADELVRLDPSSVLAFGQPAADWAEGLDLDAEVEQAPADGSAPDLPGLGEPEPAGSTVVLAVPGVDSAAAQATAQAAGAQVLPVTGPDLRADGALVQRLAELAPDRVLGLGSAFGDDERFGYTAAAARTGVQLPGGGQLILPGKRYIALYGHPGSKALGVLGEQGPQASVDRAVELAGQYAAVRSDAVVVPTFEIITTVADSSAGADGDYSSESTLEHLRPYIDAAAASGVYVVLDLQPGYTDFLTQAKRYEELLALPNVGLALDPEWRLAPGQRHMRQIGKVSAQEVNATADWLAELVRERALPQKLLLLHQFKTFMLEDRASIVADRPELAVITQMDGHGAPSTKMETWRVILQDPPAGMTFGWKNFYDEDQPTLSPAATMAVEPTPVFVSYQ
jgi:hypothetical protein